MFGNIKLRAFGAIAVAAIGISLWAVTADANSDDPPTVAIAQLNSDSVVLELLPPEKGERVAYYSIFLETEGETYREETARASQTSVVLNGLKAETLYKVSVYSHNETGAGDPYAIELTTPAAGVQVAAPPVAAAPDDKLRVPLNVPEVEGLATPPQEIKVDPVEAAPGILAQPGDLTVTKVSGDTISFSWEGSADDAGITGYDWIVSGRGSDVTGTVAANGSLDATVSGLPAGLYTVSIVSVGSGDSSRPSFTEVILP